MKKYYGALLCLGLTLVGLGSCEDGLSTIGEGIQTRNDVVESEKYYLQFEASTVEAPSIYTGSSTAGLLGAYSDPAYGTFSADFATQFRTAEGQIFAQTPVNGRLDSVELHLLFAAREGYIGSGTAPMAISVYELPQSFSGEDTSSQSLEQYADASRLLGQQVVSIERNKKSYYYSQTDSAYYLPIKLSTELGQRIYEANRQHPEYFASQETFNKQVFPGLYVRNATGSGSVLKVEGTRLRLYYSYASGDSTLTSSVSFINTKLTARADGLKSSQTEALLQPSDTHTFAKGPAGVHTAITLSKEQMQRLLANQGQTTIGENWTLADTQLKLTVDNPSEVLLNPPGYMMLMPADSVATYFRDRKTELSAAGTSYLSTAYSSTAAYYNFYNISRMLTEHLKRHASYSNGQWTVAKDLDLRLIPVSRRASTSSSYGSSQTVTTAIDEYLFPYFVRLKKDQEALRIGVVASILR